LDVLEEEGVYVVSRLSFGVGRRGGREYAVPDAEGRHRRVGSGVSAGEQVGIDAVMLESSVGGVGWGFEAERGLEVGGEVWGSSRVYGEVGVKKRCLSGDAVRVCRGVVKGERAVV
jgi:hypothetical protein